MDEAITGSPGFSPIAPDDQAGNLWILTILALIYTSMVAAARVYIKHRMYGLDDVLIAFSILLHLAQSIAVFVGLGSGIGKFNSITPQISWAASSRAFIAAEFLFILGLTFAKCSILALVLSIIGTKSGRSRLICLVLLGLAVVWGFAACLAFAIHCRADGLLTVDNESSCPRQHTRWVIITVIDILTEVAAWLLVVRITSTVNMSFKRKLQVVLAFSFRLPLVVLSGLHLAYFSSYPSAEEPQYAITNTLLIQQATIVWSIISATIPNIKNFLKSNAFPLQALGSRKSRTTGSEGAGVLSTPASGGWRLDETRNQSSVHHANLPTHATEEEDKVSRNGSQEMIINKEVAWDVTYEGIR
ncbi:hypothetical protein B0T11DRAFT_352806 [Plectosphaerella cucumerina]|uniref:Rhodopsin domain-containing protein n=1 Tax=Plectosphaerella cucumerina TaxID=40658 RepID=A0A8K0X5G6_9PEZI|nr:hypothetical protein B0T11DRAFT_352806 [Plectosphaerella cucumerina]